MVNGFIVTRIVITEMFDFFVFSVLLLTYGFTVSQGHKPGGKCGGRAMTDCFWVQTSYSQN